MPGTRNLDPSPELAGRVRVPETVLFRDLDGELVLLNLATGTYFGLDATGTRFWHLLQQHRSLQTVHTTLQEEYAAEAAQLARDLLKFVRTLTKHGLIEHASADGS